MQGIGYTFKVWLSGLFFTPIIFLALLAILPGYHIPELIGLLFITYLIPYSAIVSVWVGLGLLCGIGLLRYYDLNQRRLKLSLSLFVTLIIFSGFIILHQIPAVMMYRDDLALPLAYSITTILLIWLFNPHIDTSKSKVQSQIGIATIKNCFGYSLAVWFITFLLSVPLTQAALFLTQGFKPGSLNNAIKGIIEHYEIQLNISITSLITLLLISVIVSNLHISKRKKKGLIMLFVCPLCLPAYFYYQLFSGAVAQFSFWDIIVLIFPSFLISMVVIYLFPLKNAIK